ncbi:hypothetical protein [Dickeya zeae]|uniref:hypothetical protein n=1 Tax=Dickeya zeae TaxID=204042 RepID=UPI000A45DE46|nr:hypothetical protein [Dickeya zeae]
MTEGTNSMASGRSGLLASQDPWHWSTLYPTTGKTQLVGGLDVTTDALHRAQKPSHTGAEFLLFST